MINSQKSSAAKRAARISSRMERLVEPKSFPMPDRITTKSSPEVTLFTMPANTPRLCPNMEEGSWRALRCASRILTEIRFAFLGRPSISASTTSPRVWEEGAPEDTKTPDVSILEKVREEENSVPRMAASRQRARYMAK